MTKKKMAQETRGSYAVVRVDFQGISSKTDSPREWYPDGYRNTGNLRAV